LAWRDYIVSEWDDSGKTGWMADAGIELIRGEGAITGPGQVAVDGTRRTTEHIVIATGSETAPRQPLLAAVMPP
jgi:pyruvate/2-oxoglutarate dehydrogenase complex dihydrolipoamide dehydrogenase (E3) component